jgi:hypothetical protein
VHDEKREDDHAIVGDIGMLKTSERARWDLESLLLDQLALFIISLGRDLKALLQNTSVRNRHSQSLDQKENLPRWSRE